jgi:hypothetical protein
MLHLAQDALFSIAADIFFSYGRTALHFFIFDG